MSERKFILIGAGLLLLSWLLMMAAFWGVFKLLWPTR